MKASEFKNVAKFFKFDTLITGIIVNQGLHGLGIETAIHERLDELKQKHFRINMAEQDPFFFQEFVAMTEYHKDNDVKALLEELSLIHEKMKTVPLPQARAEFEDRANLFILMERLEEFLLIKRDFMLTVQAYYICQQNHTFCDYNSVIDYIV